MGEEKYVTEKNQRLFIQ